MVVKVAVSAAAYAIDKPYDYFIPADLEARAIPGMRALVPFGTGNKTAQGVILSSAPVSKHNKLKSVTAILDDVPLLTEESIRLAIWMSDRFFCTVFDALQAMLPAGIWHNDGGGPRGERPTNFAFLTADTDYAKKLAEQKRLSAPRQAAALDLLIQSKEMPLRELCAGARCYPGAVKALEKLGVITIAPQETPYIPDVEFFEKPQPIVLNEAQSAVYENILPLINSAAPEAALLYGVTGSGKTPVYIKLIEKVLKDGKTAIVLVPEISLTPQVTNIFASYFGDTVAVLHSGLGLSKRCEEWRRIRGGSVRVVVGTRSAIFAPINDLGLIVIDEEQEHTYKSESSPRYHAREIAKYRVAQCGALLLLTSATPSVETMYYAKTGKYKIFRIENRYNEKELPAVHIVDMKQELKNGGSLIISSLLRRELERNILCREQSILLLNRRGTNPLVTCGECGFIFKCSHCSVSMTYHSDGERMLCHYCGFSFKLKGTCPECNGKLKFVGAGTQKVEQHLRELFPGVAIIRMDADAVTRSISHDAMLSRFAGDNASILLGTQMIAKGLDFENVTLAGVISADTALYLCDYRAHEKAFSLITQVIGRCGRGLKPGRAVLQTFTPDHDVIRLSSMQDYDGFFSREIKLRKILGSPPYSDLITLNAAGANENDVLAALIRLRGALCHYLKDFGDVSIIGPAPASVPKVSNKYRYRLQLNCENNRRVRETIAHTLREFSRDKKSRGVAVFADSE